MSTIVLVNSDSQAVASLATSLREGPANWTVHLVRSGSEALALISAIAVDAVVADSQLEDMALLELFEKIQQSDPAILRFTYSADTRLEVAMESARANNRFLAKSFTPGCLARQIDSSLSLRTALANEHLSAYMSGIKAIPAMPAIYDEMVQELASPHSSLTRVANIVESDVGLSITVLKIVNSAFYGLNRRVESVAQAVTLLGAHLIKNITLTAKVFARFDGSTLSERRLSELNSEAIRIGALANHFARLAKLSRTTTDHSQIAGMMANVGKLIATVQSEQNDEAVQVPNELVGACLLRMWQMPDAVIEAVALQNHEAPQRSDSVTPLAILHSIRFLQQTYLDVLDKQQYDHCTEYLQGFVPADTVSDWLEAFQAIQQLTSSESQRAA